jgi:outer membrane protein OmpA-like peptidoglycan-associated protein
MALTLACGLAACQTVSRPPPAPPPPRQASLPMPPRPLPPPTPPAIGTFIVFFDANTATLTADAQSVVFQAVKMARTSGVTRILVTGYMVGSESPLQHLSEGRADAVKAEMIREGLAAGDITAVGRNFEDRIAASNPAVREALNRRVVIDLGR